MTEIHICSLLSLFLSLLLIFSPRNFQTHCVRPVGVESQPLFISCHCAVSSLRTPGPLTRLWPADTSARSVPGRNQHPAQNRGAGGAREESLLLPLHPPPLTSAEERWICLISSSMTAFEVLNQFFRTYHSLLTDWHLQSVQQPVQTSVRAIINEPSHITAASRWSFKRHLNCENLCLQKKTTTLFGKTDERHLESLFTGAFPCASPHALLLEWSCHFILCATKTLQGQKIPSLPITPPNFIQLGSPLPFLSS